MLVSRLGCPRWGNGAWPHVARVLCLASLLWSSTASAQEKDELARRHFESGAAYFAEAEYEDALKAFRKAYELSNRPEILLSIAAAQERLGRLDAAVEALNEYLINNPDAADIETVRLRRDNLAKRAQAQPAAPNAGATPATATAGEGRDKNAAPGTQNAETPPAPSEPNAKDAAEASGPERLPAYVLLSLGALSGVGAAITGLGAQAEYDELEQRCKPQGCSDDDTKSGEALALTSTILTGVSLASFGVGIWLWVTSSDTESEQSARSPRVPQVSVTAGASSGFATARWRF